MKKKAKQNLTRVVGGKRQLTLTGRKAVTGLAFTTVDRLLAFMKANSL